jgi:hypothetical protein
MSMSLTKAAWELLCLEFHTEMLREYRRQTTRRDASNPKCNLTLKFVLMIQAEILGYVLLSRYKALSVVTSRG